MPWPLNSNYAYRIIDARWVDDSSDEFKAKLLLSGIDNIGLVNEVTKLISNNMNVEHPFFKFYRR